jgi:hypothetical protein
MAWIPLVAAVLPSLISAMQKRNSSDPRDDIYQQSTLSKSQRQMQKQLERAIRGPGAGGAFGESADYYRSLMAPNSETEQSLIAPEMRNYNENIIPGLGEQFAGMGAGNLSSSGFQNASVGAGTDLAERLGAIRANLRQQGASGLANLGRQAMQPNVENVRNLPQPTFGENLAEGVGSVAPALAMQYYQNQQNQQAIKQSGPVAQKTSWKGGGGTPNAPMPGMKQSPYQIPQGWQ